MTMIRICLRPSSNTMRNTSTKTMIYLTFIISSCLWSRNAAFISPANSAYSMASSPPSGLLALPTPEESAKQLSDYMAKSHEEKLRAVRAAEEKKEAEIKALREELDKAKSSPPNTSSSITSPSTLPTGSSQELAEKLLAYQQFMAEYIVKAQQEKLKAVQAAEASVAKQYEDRMLLLSGGTTGTSSNVAASLPSSSNSKLFMDRNAKVSAAGQAGKSRWGDMETQRAATAAGASTPVIASKIVVDSNALVNGSVNGAVAVNEASPATSISSTSPPPEVVEADHGLRNDGGVGGPSLAERVALGAAMGGGAATTAPSLSRNQVLYQQRNAKIAAAAKAGKSRWGSMETDKATGMVLVAASSPPTITVTPEIAEADHGLRADGGVDGPTLAERVNLGAQMLKE